MIRFRAIAKIFILSFGLLATHPATAAESIMEWSKLTNLPDKEGFAGPFAGVSTNALIVAGGANFPNGYPWENGKKVWYDQAFVLESPDAKWLTGFTLPRPLAYGVSISTDTGLLCLGGGDADRHYADAFLLEWKGGKLVTTDYPPLPKPCAFMSGARLGDTVYVAGGIEEPGSTVCLHTFWSLDLKNTSAGWKELDPWPGPERMLAVAAAQDGSFFLVSGTSLHADAEGKPARTYLSDAYRFTPGKGWRQIADIPHSAVAAPSPAPALGQSHFLVLSGDDASLLDFQPLADHPGFPPRVQAYHTITDTWVEMGEVPAARVTAPVVFWNDRFVIPNGEAHPGVRSPEVWTAKPVKREAHFGMVDFTVLAAYLAVLVWIGIICSKREKTTDDFFLAGRRIAWWAAGLSILGTQLSAITFMTAPAKSFATDWVFVVNGIVLFLIGPIVVIYYLPFFRQVPITTAYEYLEKRFNVAVRLFGSLTFCLFQIGRMGVILYLPAIALSAVTGMDVIVCIALMGILSTLYTVMGGIEAVVWTDVVQVVVLLGGALVCLFLIFHDIDGGVATVIDIGMRDAKFHTFDWTWDVTTTAVWIMIFGQLLHNLMPYTADQAVIQRYLTTPTEKQAASAIWANAILSIPVVFLFFGMGTALYAFYKTHPGLLAPNLQTDAILPWFIAQQVPAGLSGLIIAAIFAAAMSSLDSSLNSVATAITTDFYQRFRKGLTDLHCLFVARVLTVLLGALATGAAIWMSRSNIGSLMDAFLKILGLFGGSLSALFMLGMFTRRATGPATLIGAAASFGVVFWVSQFTRVHFLLHAAIGIVVCLAVGYGLSLVMPGSNKDLTGLTIHTRKPVES